MSRTRAKIYSKKHCAFVSLRYVHPRITAISGYGERPGSLSGGIWGDLVIYFSLVLSYVRSARVQSRCATRSKKGR